jgi:hypothetical protein
MANKRPKPEEIVTKLRQVEVLTGQGMPRLDAIRQIGVTEQTYYLYGRLSRCKCDLVGLRRSVANIYPASAGLSQSAQMGYPHARTSTAGRPQGPR